MLYHFTVPGEPAPWCVFTRRSKPPARWLRLKAYQKRIVANLTDIPSPLIGPVRVTLMFGRGTPAKAPTKPSYRRKWQLKHIVMRPDTTNYTKACEDALKMGKVLLDDSQVVSIVASKHYTNGEEGSTDIWVETVDAGPV